MYHEKEKAATGLEPVTAKPFLPNPYLDYFDKLEVVYFFFFGFGAGSSSYIA